MLNFKDNVISAIKKFNMITPGERIVVGLSGGADSCALAHVLSDIAKDLSFTLIAAHLNHGIRGDEALHDKEFSKSFASKLGIDIITKDACVPQYAKEHKLSEEMAARIVRYEFFNEVCTQYNCTKIAVAHNKNDNAETILLNLIRGSGSKGFDGIRPVNGNIIRPLIGISRTEIEDYAKDNGISYVTDSTNTQDIYARNIIRHHLLPKMAEINSGALNNIIRCSEILSIESDYMEEEIKLHKLFRFSEDSVIIDRREFDSLHPALARRALFKAIHLACGNTQNVCSKQIDLLLSGVKTGNTFSFGNGSRAYITYDSLVFTKQLNTVSSYEYEVSVPCTIQVKETGLTYKLEFTDSFTKKPNSVCLSADKLGSLTLRTRKDGDTFKPYGMTGSKKLKSFYIDCKIPSIERNFYPLLTSGNKILAVIPLRINEDFKITEHTQKILRITIIGGTYDKL